VWKENIVPKVLAARAAAEKGDAGEAKRLITEEINPPWRALRAKLEEMAKAREQSNRHEFAAQCNAARRALLLIIVANALVVA